MTYKSSFNSVVVSSLIGVLKVAPRFKRGAFREVRHSYFETSTKRTCVWHRNLNFYYCGSILFGCQHPYEEDCLELSSRVCCLGWFATCTEKIALSCITGLCGGKITKILIFEQDLFLGHFMGENLRENLAQDLISGKMLAFLPNVRPTFGHFATRKNLEAARLFPIQTPLTNTNHSALNTRRIGFINGSGRPWSLRANVSSAAGMWLEPAEGAKKAHFGRASGVGIVCAFKQRKITLLR